MQGDLDWEWPILEATSILSFPYPKPSLTTSPASTRPLLSTCGCETVITHCCELVVTRCCEIVIADCCEVVMTHCCEKVISHS